MKVKQLLSVAALIALLFEGNKAGAQGMAVNGTGTAANSSAMLDVSSTTQGVLVPRMTSAQRLLISTPATGLIVYQTDGTPGLYCNYGSPATANWQLIGPVTAAINAGDMAYWNGTSWVQLPAGTSGQTLTFCSGKPVWSTGGACPHTIGESYGGGIVIYVDSTGSHGLIAAATDQSAGAQWYSGSYIVTGATSLTNGSSNTATIISVQGTGSYAASIAHSYSGGGYTDWYLPSKNEMYTVMASGTVLGLTSAYYWTSSEEPYGGAYDAYIITYPSEANLGGSKSSYYYVRAIRAF